MDLGLGASAVPAQAPKRLQATSVPQNGFDNEHSMCTDFVVFTIWFSVKIPVLFVRIPQVDAVHPTEVLFCSLFRY